MPNDAQLYAELWGSLASLLRSYTAAHGMHKGRHAEVEQDEERITVRHGSKSIELRRAHAAIAWKRENGESGTVELTEHGRLRSQNPRSQKRNPSASSGQALGHPVEQELDMAAEAWARELMQ